MSTAERLGGLLKLTGNDLQCGRYRTLLYRFLTDYVPAINACIWTWARLAAAPARFEVEATGEGLARRAERRLEQLMNRLYHDSTGRPVGQAGFLIDLFTGLFRDGLFGGFITVFKDGSGVDRFFPVDAAAVRFDPDPEKRRLVYEGDGRTISLDRPDFSFIPLRWGANRPLGCSILQAVPFVAYVEQQLVEDMRRASHNAGFHRLHVCITPPERLPGEADDAYIDRINAYFDSTVSMIRSCEVEDNPVTWDNVTIEYVGPDRTRGVTNAWFVSHRALIEEICAGTHLAPFLLGYSYGATTTWSDFKFDMVMRQVRTVQAEAAQFLERIARIDLALAGLDVSCRVVFDNTFPYQARDHAEIETARVGNLIKLYEAGLVEREQAVEKAGGLLSLR